MIELINITKTYKYKGIKTCALDNVNIRINSGEIVAITGESGAGKTTLLNVIGGLIRQNKGEYIFNGKNVLGNETYMAEFRNDNIGFILQNFALIKNRNISYNISLPLKYKDMTKNEINDKVKEITSYFGLEDKLKKYPIMLSGGECQRVAIARAVISNPKVILADEPTSSLDNDNKLEVIKMLINLNKTGATVIIATHDKDILRYCNRNIILNHGEIIEQKSNI